MVSKSYFVQTQGILAEGLKAYGEKLKITAQNLSNAQSTGMNPGDTPYERQSVILSSSFNKALGVNTVKVKKIIKDTENFGREYNPTHPAADEKGFILTPNVNSLEEAFNFTETLGDKERLLAVYKQTTALDHQTIGLLR